MFLVFLIFFIIGVGLMWGSVWRCSAIAYHTMWAFFTLGIAFLEGFFYEKYGDFDIKRIIAYIICAAFLYSLIRVKRVMNQSFFAPISFEDYLAYLRETGQNTLYNKLPIILFVLIFVFSIALGIALYFGWTHLN